MKMADDNSSSSSSSSFKLRVDKVFGSLSGSSSMWSLTDDEIDKKQWNRDLNRIHDDHDEPLPSSSNAPRFIPNHNAPSSSSSSSSSSKVGNELESDLLNLADEEDDDVDVDVDVDEQPSSGSQRRKKKHHRMGLSHLDNQDEDEFDVRSSIGLDSTLDYEEEEDEYDKVAVGKEKAGDDCLFMKDVTDYGADDVNTYRRTLGAHLPKDPRANHFAAQLRLKEDTDAAGNFHSLNLSDNSHFTTTPTEDLPLQDNAAIPKPILKKRQTHLPPKSNKRVRFDPQSDDSNDVEAIHLASPQPPPNANEGSCHNLPDYLKNPSKYTRYTLDSSSSDMDDEANRRAYMDFLNLIKKPTTTTDNIDAVDSSEPPTFISRKPPTVKSENECKQNQRIVSQFRTPRVGIIAVNDDHDSEGNAMEEDEQEEGVDKSVLKPDRRYRTRTVVDPELQFVT